MPILPGAALNLGVKDWLTNFYHGLVEHPFVNGVLPHLLTVAGVLLAFFAIARLMSDRKQPGNTFAWLFAIAFIPYYLATDFFGHGTVNPKANEPHVPSR